MIHGHADKKTIKLIRDFLAFILLPPPMLYDEGNYVWSSSHAPACDGGFFLLLCCRKQTQNSLLVNLFSR